MGKGIKELAGAHELEPVSLTSLVASGQIRLRKIDGWQKIAGVVSRHVSPAAA